VPGSSACTNGAAEPAIRADNTGTFYRLVELGLSSGTLAWKSTDGGPALHGAHFAEPNLPGRRGLATGGGDTDLGVAPQANASGVHNVYVASLSLANVTVSTSQDGGKTWSKNVLKPTIPGDDREWIAADQATKSDLVYQRHRDLQYRRELQLRRRRQLHAAGVGDRRRRTRSVAGKTRRATLVIDPNSHVIYAGGFSGHAQTPRGGPRPTSLPGGSRISRAEAVRRHDKPSREPNTSASYGTSSSTRAWISGTIYVVYTITQPFLRLSTDGGGHVDRGRSK